MFTVVETELFSKQWPLYWSEEELALFTAYISMYPNAGVVVPSSGGVRKVRWGRERKGKSGGVRVIYFVRNREQKVILLTLYAKSDLDSLSGSQLKEIRRALED